MALIAQCIVNQHAKTPVALGEFVLFRDRDDVSTNTPEENAAILSGLVGGGAAKKLGQGRKKKVVHRCPEK